MPSLGRIKGAARRGLPWDDKINAIAPPGFLERTAAETQAPSIRLRQRRQSTALAGAAILGGPEGQPPRVAAMDVEVPKPITPAEKYSRC
jgi:hypothetical protein